MVIDEIELHNFGIFGGRQKVALSPASKSKTVIVFGGMNGAGKTTLLEAMQVVLYGRHAVTGRRTDLAYDEYLRRLIHRGANPKDGAAVQITLRVNEDGESRNLRVRRTWSATGTRVTERLEVFRDGEPDAYLSDTWSDYVTRLIPSQLSELFFFDGERIEALADPSQSLNMLRSAIHALLGVDLVKQLQADLLVLNRRKLVEQRPAPEQAMVNAAAEEVAALTERVEEARQQRAQLNGKLMYAEKNVRELNARFAHEGGTLADERLSIERDLSALRAQRDAAEDKLRGLAAGPLPLLMVRPLLARVRDQAAAEADSTRAKLAARFAAERDVRIVQQLRAELTDRRLIERVTELLERDRELHMKVPTQDQYLHADDATRQQLDSLLDRLLEQNASEAGDAHRDLAELVHRIDDAERKLAAVPDADAIARLAAQRGAAHEDCETLRLELENWDASAGQLGRELEVKRQVFEGLHRAAREAQIANEEVVRFVRHSDRARETLDRFRVALTQKHATRLGETILESFRRLLRKGSLIHGLRIDADTCRLTLVDADGDELATERLSAGERQLLAVSILWGLARATGRPLPVIVDTPLGRLDTQHRMRLVQRYFPFASHQVILLSTDEEITGEYLVALKPKIGRFYRIEHDDDTGGSVIKPGYFGQEVAS